MNKYVFVYVKENTGSIVTKTKVVKIDKDLHLLPTHSIRKYAESLVSSKYKFLDYNKIG